VELATDMVFRLDDQGRFNYCNPAALQLLHYGEQEVIGRSFTKLVRVDMRREVSHFYMRQMARNRRNSYYEFAIVDGHGRERWVGQNVQLLTEGDRIVGFQGIARDVTERKRMEADLARRHSFLEGIASTTPGLFYVFDLAQRRTVFANREIAAVLGYKTEDTGDFDQIATIFPRYACTTKLCVAPEAATCSALSTGRVMLTATGCGSRPGRHRLRGIPMAESGRLSEWRRTLRRTMRRASV
jgi:PAS domain S-box-containing protein